MEATAKRGRPSKPYRTSWGEHIDGLRRYKDGRWVISETRETFSEPDERRAVARFKRWKAARKSPPIAIDAAVEDLGENRSSIVAAVMEAGGSIHGRRGGGYGISFDAVEPMLWSWMREQLISRPEHAAQMTGIPELARLADLPKRQPSPTLKAIGDLYQAKADVTEHQRRRMGRFWTSFTSWMSKHEVKTLRELTPALAADFADHVRAGGDSAKYIRHRFTSIRGVINFARKRGENPGDIRHALDCLAVLQAPKDRTTRSPRPIGREAFQSLLGQADDRMKAALLIMLNCCMYPGEAIALNWDDLDLARGTVVTRRPKTGVVRVAVLWGRTIEAIRSLRGQNQGGNDAAIIVSREGNRLHIKTFAKHFQTLRKKADVSDDVKAEDCRDGAYTAAIDAGVDLTVTKLLAGHQTGISDHYTERRPTMVAEACRAIEAAYFG